ncbi:MAG TPA: aminobutyraldehyde dehydrogenase [Streptosporangiaceae bacterium]|jgi:betaine-aldehyde dehydrogenase|nr:aminobutyraldehyde dehydrogenase [Streptosporangiaceae bacterium]
MRKKLPLHLLNFIGGSPQEAASGRRSVVTSPGDGREIATVPDSGAEDVGQAVAAAQRAFKTWSQTTPRQRQAALLALADILQAHDNELAELEALDAGKPIIVVRPEELEHGLDNLRFFAGAARLLEGRAAGEYMPGRTSWTRREPVGVVGGIAPWNYPILMALWKVGPAIAAGNTVVLKPAPSTPVTALRMAELAADAFPPGVLNVVAGGDEVGQAIVKDPRIAMVSLTGSVETGKWIARTAADTLKRVHLELGGNAPVIVFDDADIDDVVPKIAAVGYYNAGQDCTAATRVIASAKRYDDIVAGLAEQAKRLVLGDVLSPRTTMGPVNSAGQLQRITGFLDRLDAGSEVVTGGGRLSGDGFYLEPTVVSASDPAAEIVQKEIFGPVMTVQRFTDEEQALQWANSTSYGLSASVWTSDVKRALRVSRALQFGVVWINDHMSQVSEMPHGGIKDSGYGKDLSMYAVEEYTTVKHVMAAWED